MNTDRLQERNTATHSVQNPTGTNAYPLNPTLHQCFTTEIRRTHGTRGVNIVPQSSDNSTTTNEPTRAPSDQCQTSDAILNPGFNFPSPFMSEQWSSSDFSIADSQDQYAKEPVLAMEDLNVQFQSANETGVPAKAGQSKYMNGPEIQTGDEKGYCMDRSLVPEAALRAQSIHPVRAPEDVRQDDHTQRSGHSTRATQAQYLNAVSTMNYLPTELAVERNVDIEDLVHCAGLKYGHRGDREMTQPRRDMSATVMQVARRGTNEQVQAPAVVAHRRSVVSMKQNRSDHRGPTGVEPSYFRNVDRGTPDNRQETSISAINHDENFSLRPRRQEQRLQNVRAKNTCPTQNQTARSFTVSPSGRTMETTKSKDCQNLPSSANIHDGMADVLCPSTPRISLHPLYVENDFTNENRNAPGRSIQVEDLGIIHNSMQNGELGQNLSQLQDPLEECQMDAQSPRGFFPEPSFSDRWMMLSAGESQTPSLSTSVLNLNNTDTTPFMEMNGNMQTLNTGAVLYSRREDSTITFNDQHLATVGSIQEVPETPMTEPNEREPEDCANVETERNMFSFHNFPDTGGIDRFYSQAQHETGDYATSMRNPSTPINGNVKADRPNASQLQCGQAVRATQPQNKEIDICDAKDAFYNYDWTLLSFSERRKRRAQILKSKRLPTSETAANGDQQIDYGKVPDSVIIELSTAYPRQNPNRTKTRKLRNRMAALNIRKQTRNQLEFHQEENKKLLLKLSEYNAQLLALGRQLGQAQDRLRKREAETAHLRMDNNRLRTTIVGLRTRDRILLDALSR